MAMVTLPPITTVPRPRVYNWVGTAASPLYWDDPTNWAEGECPNHPEATAVFSHSLSRSITILMRRDIMVANLWFSEREHSYTIAPEGDPEHARLFFVTGQQLANLVLDEENFATHTIIVRMIHSCKKLWGPGWETQTIPTPTSPIVAPQNQSKLRLVGSIENYKPAPRASLNLDGYLDVEISGINSFIGPVDIRRGSLIVQRSESIPTGSTLSIFDPGRISIDDGVVVRVRRLNINGEKMPMGLYHASDMPATAAAKLAPIMRSASVSARVSLEAVRGLGAIVVSGEN
jgi:hypothetical protein